MHLLHNAPLIMRSLALLIALSLVSVTTAAAQPAMMPMTAEEPIDAEIGTGAHVGGVVANVFIGFGLGQAIQGRWTETGWMFTLGTAVTLGAFFGGTGGNATLALAGMVGFGVVYGLGIYDAAAGPSRHNARVREERMRRYSTPMILPYVSRAQVQGNVAGLSLRF